MLYDGKFGKSLITDEFLGQCIEHHVEAAVKPFPNPGSPFQSLRQISFKNFSNLSVKVKQQDRKKKEHIIPGKGTLDILLMPDEPLPLLEKGQ